MSFIKIIMKLNNSIKLIVCDMAGTTVNEGGIVYKTLYETIKQFNIKIDKDEIKNWYGINKTEVLNYFLTRDENISSEGKPEILKEMLATFKSNLKNNYYNDNCIKLIHPHLPSHFNKLRESGIKIALNSGFSVDIQENLINNLNMGEFIDGYISSENVPCGRPEPFMIQELMKRFDITDPHTVIKIGDSMNDILEGKNAQCYKSIGVLSGAETRENLVKAGADEILDSVMDLELK